MPWFLRWVITRKDDPVLINNEKDPSYLIWSILFIKSSYLLLSFSCDRLFLNGLIMKLQPFQLWNEGIMTSRLSSSSRLLPSTRTAEQTSSKLSITTVSSTFISFLNIYLSNYLTWPFSYSSQDYQKVLKAKTFSLKNRKFMHVK